MSLPSLNKVITYLLYGLAIELSTLVIPFSTEAINYFLLIGIKSVDKTKSSHMNYNLLLIRNS